MSPQWVNFLTQAIALLAGLSIGISLVIAHRYTPRAWRLRGTQAGALARHVVTIGIGFSVLSFVIVAAIKAELSRDVSLILFTLGYLLVVWAQVMILRLVKRRDAALKDRREHG